MTFLGIEITVTQGVYLLVIAVVCGALVGKLWDNRRK